MKPLLPLVVLVLTSCAVSPDQIPRSVDEFFDRLEWNPERFLISSQDESADLQYHVRYYLADRGRERLWASYSGFVPSRLWNGPVARFGLLLEADPLRFVPPSNRDVPRIAVDQIIALDLFVEYMVHLPVVFEVTSLDPREHVIEFTYLKENRANGRQRIDFLELDSDGPEVTLLRHSSWYRSDSRFRDSAVYPPYHSQILDEFHFRMADLENYRLKVVSEKYLRRRGLLPAGTETVRCRRRVPVR